MRLVSNYFLPSTEAFRVAVLKNCMFSATSLNLSDLPTRCTVPAYSKWVLRPRNELIISNHGAWIVWMALVWNFNVLKFHATCHRAHSDLTSNTDRVNGHRGTGFAHKSWIGSFAKLLDVSSSSHVKCHINVRNVQETCPYNVFFYFK